MYERSAIILEKYYNNLFGFDKKENLKTIYKDFKYTTEEMKKYQEILKEEDQTINEFDRIANEIRNLQQEQKRIYKANIKYEEERNQLFDNFEEEPISIEKKLIKIEEKLKENNKSLEEIREKFIKSMTEFSEKQSERNKISRNRRTEEKEYLQLIEKSNNDIESISGEIISKIKNFINSENEKFTVEITDIMINNGKDERVPFNKDVIENAVKIRNDIAQKEATCYITIYDRLKKLLTEVNGDDIKVEKYIKTLRDISVKLSFLKAQKMYIVSFLDNERMTAINGVKLHNNLMKEACEEFNTDMEQFNNLYELILREISGKSSKKAYKELYNKEYLKQIEEKEKNFEKELNSIKVNSGSIINSNYWRIEEIKNIYNVFQKEITEKFEKDLSEFILEKEEKTGELKTESDKIEKIEDAIFGKNIEKSEDDDEYEDDIEEYKEEYEDDDEYEEDDEEYEDDDEYEEDDEEYEDDDEYEEDEEYEDDDEYEEDEEYEDDDEYEEDDGEYEDDDEEYEDDDENEEIDEVDEEDTVEEKENKKGKGLFNKFFKDK